MILETVEVHDSPNSRLFGLRPTFAAGFLQANFQSRGRQLRQPLPIVASTQIFLGDEAVNRA
jgi:hypothetical protein